MTRERTIKRFIKSLAVTQKIARALDNQYAREDFVVAQLRTLPNQSSILDAGCGGQRYRQYCDHLRYSAQDAGQYANDARKMFGSPTDAYSYGKLDYVGDIWQIEESAEAFDTILCTEVLEHIPYPVETIKEFRRLLKPHGILILTAPSNCLRHMDPYFYYSGFSDRWFKKILPENNFEIQKLEAIGDYYRWLMVEMFRTAKTHSFLSKLLLAPALVYYSNKKKTEESVNTLCMGYHIVAKKSPMGSPRPSSP